MDQPWGGGAFGGGGGRAGAAQRRRRRPPVTGPAEGLGGAGRGLGGEQHRSQGLEVAGGAGQLPGVASPDGHGLPSPGGKQRRVARAGQLEQAGGRVLSPWGALA